MKLKQIDSWEEDVPKKPKSIKGIQNKINELELDLEAIIEEHNKYTLPNSNEAAKWMNSLPINSLYDSLLCDNDKYTSFFSIRNMHHRPKLRKLFEKTLDEYESLKSELQVKRIDKVLAKIKKVENKHGI